MIQRLRVALFLLCTAGCSLYQSWAIDPCLIYSTYSDEWRDPARGADPKYCDSGLREGWYTFHLGSKRAYIPTTCMQEDTCGTKVPLRVELPKGQAMPGEGETINASLCGSARVLNTLECCVLRQDIRIKHCTQPSAFIYYLKPVTQCLAAICVLHVGEEADRVYRFESGDLPKSLQPTTTSTTSNPSTDSSSPALNTTTELTSSSSPNATEATSQENTTMPVSSTETTVPTTSSTAEMASVTASSSTGLPQDSYSLQFILQGGCEDPQGVDVLSSLEKAVRLSKQGADPDDSSAPILVNVHCSGRVLIALVTIISNATDGGMSDDTVQEVGDLAAFQRSLPYNVTLLAACTVQGPCQQPERVGSTERQTTPSAVSSTNLVLILIIVVALVALGLLTFGSVRLYKHCSKQGTWVPPPDQKGDAESADTSKPTDTVNGGDPTNTQSANGPDASKPDDAGWWVVPLDQAPGNADVEDKKTQDTRM